MLSIEDMTVSYSLGIQQMRIQQVFKWIFSQQLINPQVFLFLFDPILTLIITLFHSVLLTCYWFFERKRKEGEGEGEGEEEEKEEEEKEQEEE